MRRIAWGVLGFWLTWLSGWAGAAVVLETSELVAQRRVNRFVFEYDYRLKVRNTGPEAVESATVRMTANASYVTVVDGEARFGPMAAGETAVSDDTTTLRIDRRRRVRPGDIDYHITPVYAPDTGAPPLPPGEAPAFLDRVSFLYAGSDPEQPGADPGAFDPKRIAVIRGEVRDRDGNPLSGLEITIKDHPEYGRGESRADGTFDLAVNGGGYLVVEYRKPGYLPVQRRIRVPWRDFVVAETVVMTPLDPQVTAVDLADTSQAFQVARGSVTEDAAGQRRATLLFPAGVTATVTRPDGSTEALEQLHVRATEYTVGDDGPKAMPGPLPPASGYTYAVELSVDEAPDGRIEFDKPVIVYVDNFLGIPAGEPVPAGWYDTAESAWIPAGDGRVIAILDTAGGIARLDVDGDGLEDSGAKLADLGIGDAERIRLAGLYDPGQSLWRVPVTHFTPWDFNWPWGLPEDAEGPKTEIPDPEPVPDKDENECGGCIIQPQSQSLGETVPVIGTPFELVYQSERMPGYHPHRTLRIPLAQGPVPASLARIDLTVTIAGQIFRQSYAPAPDRTVTFTWDGRDAYGRPVPEARANVIIDYRYPLVYYSSRGAWSRSFARARASGARVIAVRNPNILAHLKRSYSLSLPGLPPDSSMLGGWRLDAHHAYDANSQTLILGDGTRLKADRLGHVIETVAGNGQRGYDGDGGPATETPLHAYYTDVGPDGSLYISAYDRIRRVYPDGTIATLPQTQGLGYIRNLAVGADGSVYFIVVPSPRCIMVSCGQGRYVYRLTPDGVLTHIAGNGSYGPAGDGGPATSAQLMEVVGMDVGPDGSVYLADFRHHRVRKVGPDGIIQTVVYLGQRLYDVAVAPDGSLYIASHDHRVYRYFPDGRLTVVASAGLGRVSGVDVSSSGEVAITDWIDHRRIWRLGADGTLFPLAGNGAYGSTGEGGSAREAALAGGLDASYGPDGSLYFAEADTGRIRRIGLSLSGSFTGGSIVPSRDGRLLYHFDVAGKHLATLDAITGVRLLAFRYDGNGDLSEIEDRDGRITRIERDPNGDPLVIVAPDGQRTELQVNADGYLVHITDPAGASWEITYTEDGLMTGFTDRGGHTHTYAFEADGRLKQDTDPLGGGWRLTRTEGNGTFEVAMTSGEGLTTRFGVEPLADGRRQTVTAPDGTRTVTNFLDTLTVVTGATGAVTRLREGPAPRFGLRAPLLESLQITQPSGLRLQAGTERTVTLADPTDPLSVQSWTETATVNGKTATRTYDATTRTWTAATPEGRQVTTRLDTQGRAVETRIPGLDPVRVSYDSQGRIYRIAQGTGPAERVSVFAYHPEGWLAQVTDPEGRTTGYQYDPAGRVTRQTLPDGRAIQYAYDAEGHLTELIPPGRPPHRFLLDARHDPAEYQPPATSDVPFPETVYQLDLNRRPVRIIRPDGQTLDFHYDSGGRLQTLTLPTGDIDLSYDAAGRLQSQTRAGLTLTHAYDGGLPVNVTWSGEITGSILWTWNEDFDVTRQCVQTQCIDFHYDRDGLVTGAGQLTLSHDPQNGLLTRTALGQLQTTWTYNGFSEVTARRVQFNTADRYHLQLQRDRLGRIVQKTETLPGGETHSAHYTYDSAGRLIQADEDGLVTTWEYDANGNRLRENGIPIAQYDDQDRLLNWKGIAYTYTENGERKSKTQGGRTTTYTYDVLGNLIQVALPNGTVIDYLIDPQGRRVGKKVDGVRQTAWLYQDDLRPAARLDGQGRLEQLYVYGDQPNVPAYLIAIAPDGTQTPYRLITDHLGSVRLVVDAKSCQIAQRIDYDVWGNVLHDSHPGFQPFGFAGGLYDPDTGLIRFGARDYDPETGRWTAKDPILFQGGDANLYGYVLQDPVNWIDPSGNIPLDTLWDLSNVAWDLFVTGNRCDLAADLAALAVPYLPAGVTKVVGAVTKTPIWSSTKNRTSAENAFKHWQKHRSEFPELQNAKQYVEGAWKFLNDPPKGTLSKTNNRGDILRYDPSTNTFGVLSKNGVPRTMFRPRDGINYWNRQ